jgi:hypothetical protein
MNIEDFDDMYASEEEIIRQDNHSEDSDLQEPEIVQNLTGRSMLPQHLKFTSLTSTQTRKHCWKQSLLPVDRTRRQRRRVKRDSRQIENDESEQREKGKKWVSMATGIGQLSFCGVYRDFKLSVHTTMQRPQTHPFSHSHFPIFPFSFFIFPFFIFPFLFSHSHFPFSHSHF